MKKKLRKISMKVAAEPERFAKHLGFLWSGLLDYE